jgi:heme-degrading monooxygenase HmoA
MTVGISFHTAPPPSSGGTILRALREDVDFPYVVVGAGDEYEVLRDEGEVDRAGGVIFVNGFEVGEGDDSAFADAWDGARAALEAQHGFLGRRLHRAIGPAELRFVNIARWSSPLMFARAVRTPEVEAAMAAIDFPSHPALYLPVEAAA